MSAVALAPAALDRRLVPGLGLLEGRRLLLHPVTLLGFAVWSFVIVYDQVTGTFVVQRFESVTAALSFLPGVPCILAGHMLATRDRRAGSLDLLHAAPAQAMDRVRALCLGALLPGAVALLLNLALTGWYLATADFAVRPSLAQVVQAPVTVTGACLLGTMLGVWLPSRATPVIAMVVLVALDVALYNTGTQGNLFAPMVAWADWGPYDGSVWYAMIPGSPAGHVVYLAGLCSLAAVGAVLRVAERRAPVLVAGVVALVVTVAGGWAQLP
ncbi:MAG: hypothetical protein J7518_07940 [Nocardioidaceae bacterium]|nr:hypothetical protein [Nocardioidaceae bacterium]